MASFDDLLKEYTEKGNAKVHGVIAKCVDKEGMPRMILLTRSVLMRVSRKGDIQQDIWL